MANKRRDRNGYKKQLGRYRLSRADILTIEKMLRVYADTREMKHAEVSEMPLKRKHMPRRAVDRHIQVGRYKPFHLTFGWNEFGVHYAGVDWIYTADSVKFLPKFIKRTRYVEVACKPGITVTFTPLTTTVYAQTHYATGRELKVMKETVLAIENYLSKVTKSRLNNCRLERTGTI